jgi:hypothetical protein
MAIFDFLERKSEKLLHSNCELIAAAPPGDTRPLAKHLGDMSLTYYRDVRWQAQESFLVALAMGVVGVCFFLYGARHAMDDPVSQGLSPKAVGLIGGAVVHVIAAIQLFMYRQASRQFASFHVCLERMNRFLLAETISQNLPNDAAKEAARTELIHVIATAPMLELDQDGAFTPPSAGGTQKTFPQPVENVATKAAA